jgi:hypothetical protein
VRPSLYAFSSDRAGARGQGYGREADASSFVDRAHGAALALGTLTRSRGCKRRDGRDQIATDVPARLRPDSNGSGRFIPFNGAPFDGGYEPLFVSMGKEENGESSTENAD